MIGPPPSTKDVAVLQKWCEELYNWIIFPEKFECNFIELSEQSADVAAPGLNRVRIYSKDNGSAKTLLVARFNTGDVQTVATEP